MIDPIVVRARILEILTSPDSMSLQLDISSIEDSNSLSEDLALDSIQILELGIAIEDDFGLSIDIKLLGDTLNQFGALVTYIAQNAKISAEKA